MTTANSRPMRPSTLGLIVLAMLIEEPMHVYRLQKLIKDRGKDKVVNVRQRTSLHQVVDRLVAHGLVEEAEHETSDSYPGRRIYAITPAGRQVALDWLSMMVTGLPEEFTQFPAALSVLTMVDPETAAGLIAERMAAVEQLLDALRGQEAPADLPRIFLIEDEYRVRLLEAELGWLGEIRRDLQEHALDWQAPQS